MRGMLVTSNGQTVRVRTKAQVFAAVRFLKRLQLLQRLAKAVAPFAA